MHRNPGQCNAAELSVLAAGLLSLPSVRTFGWQAALAAIAASPAC
jgi:hypothetical protein